MQVGHQQQQQQQQEGAEGLSAVVVVKYFAQVLAEQKLQLGPEFADGPQRVPSWTPLILVSSRLQQLLQGLSLLRRPASAHGDTKSLS